MNLLLLEPEEVEADGHAVLTGRRAVHAREVLRAQQGDALRVGVVGGRIGTGVVETPGDPLRLRVALTDDPPPRPGIDLLLAIPRPKALKKVLPAAASLGVDRLVLLNAARVEKSYFDSKVLERQFLTGLLDLGLEQAKDTRRPQVLIRERFKPFVEDELDGMFPESRRLVAHPAKAPSAAALANERVLLAIGPEGGWVQFELELLKSRGFVTWSAGPRTLRVETAVPFLIGALATERRHAPV